MSLNTGGERKGVYRVTVQKLDVRLLPSGCITHLEVVLAHNALGLDVSVPVIAMRGEKPGPVFGITAAIHGNEVNGIPVIHGLFKSMNSAKLKGTVVAVPVVNQPGFLAGTRIFKDGVDLNLVMPGKKGNEGELYAHRFCERVLCDFDYLIDLHTASFGRINSLYVRADMSDSLTARLAHLLRPEIILDNRANDGTLRGYAMSQGIPSITLEIGNPHRYHREYIRRSISGIKALLGETKMLPKRHRTPGPMPVLCEKSYWLYTDHGGLLEVLPELVEHVEKDQVIAQLSDIYGNLICEYRAPEAGIVIGKSVHPVSQSGARILHLGIPQKDNAGTESE